ncbi:hypothetical protein CHLNCDRAFT_136739 [Chlorella variabilis]|uniref:Metallo-beta-lactamase domain-containing protein n=1 Tax=Chlorella variabilis TaxID=554065 RepID=E1ZKZ1_CHLVA|nr:hypothetical protein CHLNCDRAFT_136739 [Chlorella variabilis]EFN53466.1 hypothetical protein CHLNCDRAFT_136739 [Chlorella variabilis]|eukprot:XP_005845568.1 hypothetical protein CHLNCDRAFT_136739 [Chlorella variabilis]
MRLGPALVALLSAGVAVLVLKPAGPAPRFEQVADGLLTQWWQPVPGLLSIPVSVFLAGQDGKWVLIDAGVPGTPRQPLAEQLVGALQAAIPAGNKLAAILVSHHHPDHIGALPLLLAAYPDASVAFHEKEQPFLVGDENLVQPGSVEARVLRWAGLLGTAPVPADRAHAWEGPLADLRDFGVDDLLYVATPGHSRGHISVLHHPSRTLLALDGVSFVRPSLRLSGPQDAGDARVVRTLKPWPSLPGLTLRAEPMVICQRRAGCDRDRAMISLCLLADAMDYDRVLASHDLAAGNSVGGGWTQDKMIAMAATLPECMRDSGHTDNHGHPDRQLLDGEEEEVFFDGAGDEEAVGSEFGGGEEEEQETEADDDGVGADGLAEEEGGPYE